MSHTSEDIDKLTPTDERHSEEGSAGGDLRVVQVPSSALGRRGTGKIGVLPVDARVVERGRILIHEKVPVEPA